MTKHKRQWIVYMMQIIEPKAGLEQSCYDLLSERYDKAYWKGYEDHEREQEAKVILTRTTEESE